MPQTIFPLTDSKVDKLLVFPLSFSFLASLNKDYSKYFSFLLQGEAEELLGGEQAVQCIVRKKGAIIREARPAARRRPADLATLASFFSS